MISGVILIEASLSESEVVSHALSFFALYSIFVADDYIWPWGGLPGVSID